MSSSRSAQLTDPSRILHPWLECREYVKDGEIWFECGKDKLIFLCRGRSQGILTTTETKIDDEDIQYDQMDPNFFDTGYTLAGKTGFQVWAGSRLLLETLLPSSSTSDKLKHLQKDFMQSDCKILELGAGVGVVGALLAHTGASVLLTDLRTLVDNSTQSNLEFNRNEDIQETLSVEWMPEMSRIVPIGKGVASSAPLDWTQSVSDQLPLEAISSLDYIISSDCVWLTSMLDALLNTVAQIFDANDEAPTLILSFQRRETSGDGMFTTVDDVIEAIEKREWHLECLAWRHVILEGAPTDKEVFVFCVAPSRPKLSP